VSSTGAVATPAALAEPGVRVRARWVGLLVVANLGVWMAFFTPIQVLRPRQVLAIAPDSKEAMLGWVTGLGALAAVVANPLAGALSDRTAGRFGRRHPWTLGGALLGGVRCCSCPSSARCSGWPWPGCSPRSASTPCSPH